MQESLQRLKSHRDFVTVLKTRTKVSSKDLVVHFHIRPEFIMQDDIPLMTSAEQIRLEALGPQDRRLGLAVSKAVGNAVMRNRVKRRLRVLARQYVNLLPSSCDVVIRAKPCANTASFEELDRQVRHTFTKIATRIEAQLSHGDVQ